MNYLDTEWWPKIIAQINEQKEGLSQLPGGNPIHKWSEEVIDAAKPPQQHGFEADEID